MSLAKKVLISSLLLIGGISKVFAFPHITEFACPNPSFLTNLAQQFWVSPNNGNEITLNGDMPFAPWIHQTIGGEQFDGSPIVSAKFVQVKLAGMDPQCVYSLTDAHGHTSSAVFFYPDTNAYQYDRFILTNGRDYSNDANTKFIMLPKL